MAITKTPRTVFRAAALIGAGLAIASSLSAALPPAGSRIGNQATATYVDVTGTTRNASSNLVETVIAQVAGLELVASQVKQVTPGATVYFPHSVTNTGNGPDRYNLATVDNAGGFDFTSVVIYADANGDGIPDNFTPITVTPLLAGGASFNVVIAAVVAPTVAAGQTDSIDLSATSVFNALETETNTDTVNVTNNAVVNVTKAESVTTGGPGTAVTVTLTYTNTGNATATNVVIDDALPTGMTYSSGSGRWSNSGTTILTDAADSGVDPAGINYSFASNTVTANIASVAPGQSGTITFNVAITAATPPGPVPNTAVLDYADGGGNTILNQPSNTVTFTVTAAAAVSLSDSGSGTDGDGAANDVVSVATAPQGGTVLFENVLTNNGTGTDTFDITLDSSGFPAGTAISFLRPDGATLMTDSNGNGTPDTGPLAPGAIIDVVVRVVLPNGTTGGPFSLVKRARSTVNPAISDTTTDTLGAIAANTVDLTNTSAGAAAPGAGTGPEVAPVTTVAVNPGATASFSLFVNNTSSVADNYNLQASTDPTFAAITLPTGWTVSFRNASNGVITNTGSVAAGGNFAVTALVSVPTNAAPVTAQPIYFRAVSPVTGALDRKFDAVTVNTVLDLAITPSNVGQTFPGGSTVYNHTVTNLGNALVASATLGTANTLAGWTSVVYFDANSNGAIDPTDPIIDNINDAVPGGLAAGESVRVLVQVFAPAGAAFGQGNQTTVTLETLVGETNAANNAAQDTTTVVTGDVQVRKFQALDTNCDGTFEIDLTQATIDSTLAVPGSCVTYEIVVNNSGGTTASNLVVSDTTPPLTTFNNCAGACAATPAGIATTPAVGMSGAVSFNVGTLAAGASQTLRFSVRIDSN